MNMGWQLVKIWESYTFFSNSMVPVKEFKNICIDDKCVDCRVGFMFVL